MSFFYLFIYFIVITNIFLEPSFTDSVFRFSFRFCFCFRDSVSVSGFHILVLPCLRPFLGHNYGRRKPTETSVFEFSYLYVNSSLEELIEIKAIFILGQGMFR